MTMISASILNGDLARLSEVAAEVKAFGADALHYDVMDGCFVDNLSFGIPVLECLRSYTDMPIDVHLMIRDPLRFIDRFVTAGADLISFHIEAESEPAAVIQQIHSHGIRAGIAVSPDTPVETVYPLLPLLHEGDFVLLMTVQPGLGGQSFLQHVLKKIETLKTYIMQAGLQLHIQVDGGINAETGAACRKAGADFLVAGSYLLHAANPSEAVASLRES